MAEYNPGAVVTVGALEVGDTVFLRERKGRPGLPIPTHAARVTDLVPIPDGRVRVYVVNANEGGGVEPRLLGDLPATREFRAAVLAV
ncbi:hypothetical protein [Microbacterium sp. zg-YB36]|uniref:hypothetical protein n=1 Tax=Microbacterium sp. zg-YB36 TaxID=2969407 RepID=UPI00214B8C25|nr:hypothetical protein [Microbacterium sp. zg-YB36]MDL5351591.1 hypothetical protein [Microbacterium sp. zg-YB36]